MSEFFNRGAMASTQPRQDNLSESSITTPMIQEPMGDTIDTMAEGRLAPTNGSIRELNIREVNRGFIVQAGCHTFAISKADELIALLTAYITNPNEIENKWFNGELIKR